MAARVFVKKFFVTCFVFIAAAALMSCSSARIPYNAQLADNALVPGFGNVRVWSDEPRARIDGLWSAKAAQKSKHLNILALSGGGAEGAFGAGVLKGWSAQGNRPKFDVVSGTSAGAFVAVFAFLGEEYDHQLERVFTQEMTSRLVKIAGLNAIFGTAVYSGKPLEGMVEKYIDQDIIDAVAQAHLDGRRLFITTTNIDNQRTAIWDMGAIAASDNPDAPQFFRTILLASAAVPGLLPPRMIEMQSGTQRFSEMHVDGGVSSNVMVVPTALLISGQKAYSRAKPTFYLLYNGRKDREFRLTNPHTIEVLERSFGTAIKSNALNTMLATRTLLKKHGWTIKATALDPSYPVLKHEAQLKESELRELFAEGLRHGASKNLWQ